MPPPQHIPQRSCVACHQTMAKRELIRIVRGLEGRVAVDTTGKRAGRGAYLCPKRKCWELGLKRDRLGRALHTSISPEDLKALTEYSATLSVE